MEEEAAYQKPRLNKYPLGLDA